MFLDGELAALRTALAAIGKSTPFRRSLAAEIVGNAQAAIDELAAAAHQRGERRFLGTLERYLAEAAPGTRLVALCGARRWDSPFVDLYLERVLHFTRRPAAWERQPRPRATWIFVEPSGGFPREVLERLGQHETASGGAVEALVMPREKQAALDLEVPWLAERLPAGFGFGVIQSPGQSTGFAHAGGGRELEFAVFHEPWVVQEIAGLHEWLAGLTVSLDARRRRPPLEPPASDGEPHPHAWDPSTPLSLVDFIDVEDRFLDYDRHALMERLGGGGSPDRIARRQHVHLCQAAYEQVRTHGWIYEHERGGRDYTRQWIRPPREMFAGGEGTCLDFACYFAALLETMQATPVVVRFHSPGGAHAVAGTWHRNPRDDALVRDPGIVREAVWYGDLCLFESTGAACAAESVAGETRDHGGYLAFDNAVATAEELLTTGGVRLDFLLHVLAARVAWS